MIENEVSTQIADLLLKNTLGTIQESVEKKIDEYNTSINAKLDGLKVELNEKISEIESITQEKPLLINLGTLKTPKKKLVHKQFKTVLNILKSAKRNPKNIMLVGEAGSGKTHLASNVADALKLPFYPMSVGLQTTKSDLLGFINAHGEYITSPIRQAFESGGVLLLDEFDAAHAGVVTIINSLLANGHCSFPDKVVEKNKNFICICACNTYGHGANIDYVGRNRLDAATLDRFVVVDCGYDSKLEKKLTDNEEWYSIIEKMRNNVQKNGVKLIISPRASMNGADLLEQGFPIEDVIEMTILKGANKDVRSTVLKGINLDKKQATKKQKSHIMELREDVNYIEINFDTNDIRVKHRISREQKDSFCYIGEYKLYVGTNWSYEFDTDSPWYFDTERNTGINSERKTELRKLRDVLKSVDSSERKTIYINPTVFEYIENGESEIYGVGDYYEEV